MSDLTVRLVTLISHAAPVATPDPALTVDRRPLDRKMSRVETGLDRVNAWMSDPEAVRERAELNQFQEELSDYKT